MKGERAGGQETDRANRQKQEIYTRWQRIVVNPAPKKKIYFVVGLVELFSIRSNTLDMQYSRSN